MRFFISILPSLVFGRPRFPVRGPEDLLIEIAPLPEIGVNKRVVNTGKVLNSGLLAVNLSLPSRVRARNSNLQ